MFEIKQAKTVLEARCKKERKDWHGESIFSINYFTNATKMKIILMGI